LGVPFDRVGDSILNPYERRVRLMYLRMTAERQKSRPKKDETTGFREDEFRLEALGDNPSALFDYVRARKRIARAVAVYTPALGISTTLGMSDLTLGWKGVAFGATVLVYVIAFFLARPFDRDTVHDFPRAESFRVDNPDHKKYSYPLADRVIWLSTFLFVELTVLAFRGPQLAWGVLGATVLLAVTALWAYSRIQITEMTYLGKLRSKAPAGDRGAGTGPIPDAPDRSSGDR
jgi:hypothetical protein